MKCISETCSLANAGVSFFRAASSTPLRAWPTPLSTRRELVSWPLETAPTPSAFALFHRLASRLLRWRRSQTRIAGEIAVSQPLAHDGAERLDESARVTRRIAPLVVAEYLLVNVPMKVERIHGDVGAAQPTLEQTPEVFESVGVDVALHVGRSLVDDAVDVVVPNRPVRSKHVGDDLA